MNEKRDWSGAEQRRSEAAELEQLMRHILSLFSAGCLVYRDRESVSAEKVLSQSNRLKRVRKHLSGEVALA